MSTEVIEILNGISQALNKKHFGALDEDGKPVEIGLTREKNNGFRERPMFDGFGVTMNDDVLTVHYHSEISLKDVSKKGFESKIEGIIEDCVSYMKKEYKKVTKKSLELKELDEASLRVESVSAQRNFVIATKQYKMSGLKGSPKNPKTVEERLSDSYKKFLGWGKDKW